jgi:NAD(P)-dependent dehydrogenase (short-subunit alcohol dehydrogenase family)
VSQFLLQRLLHCNWHLVNPLVLLLHLLFPDLLLNHESERIDVLANVAGVMDSFSSADTITDAEWDRVIAVNLTAPIKMMREVLPFLQAKKQGCIINVSSKAGVSGAAAGIAYTASKHGLVSISLR